MHPIIPVHYVPVKLVGNRQLVHEGPEAYTLHDAVDMYMIGFQNKGGNNFSNIKICFARLQKHDLCRIA